ncbi:unnamed protein product [Spirodela intermedia]|uniref:Uncharacterized protein n=1 Tax=Spirodela intermedia TaxID=51605 RepID=A0A7I8J4S6_SPIIN|nr:unnamed protein product [Spirodela intermedia]CAA6665091.1 unnamed protein product [Spirodela intermedia]
MLSQSKNFYFQFFSQNVSHNFFQTYMLEHMRFLIF